MAQLGYLASTLLMGLFLVAVVAFLRLAERREYSPSLSGGESSPAATLRRTTDSPTTWIVVFLLATFGVGLASVAYVGGLVPAESAVVDVAGPVLGVVVAVLVGGYLLWGAYSTARARGYQNAAAVMVSSWVLGLLFVMAIAAYLLTG